MPTSYLIDAKGVIRYVHRGFRKGDVDDIKGQIAQPDGSIAPLFVPAAQAYIVPFVEEQTLVDDLVGELRGMAGTIDAQLAHEVRNPLGVIRASASMVQENFEIGDEAHRACSFITEEIDRLNRLITSLLTFALVET